MGHGGAQVPGKCAHRREPQPMEVDKMSEINLRTACARKLHILQLQRQTGTQVPCMSLVRIFGFRSTLSARK